VRDVALLDGRVVGLEKARGPRLDLGGRWLLPGLVNALDQLDLSVFPPLGSPPFASLYDWAASVEAIGERAVRAAVAVPVINRLFLGGLRNLLAGATAVVHHHPPHRSLERDDFPVRVLGRYQFADSPGRTRALRRTYRSTDRRIPWFVRAAEGTDDRARAELDVLAEANVLRQNTVILHGTGLRAEDAARIASAQASVVWCPEADRRLYGATAPVRELRAAGVRVALGSDSPPSGSRDALSNLAAARREGVFDDAALLDLATRASGEVARLPVGGYEEGCVGDFVVVDDLDRFLSGDRTAIALVVARGRAAYGEAGLLDRAEVAGRDLEVDGAVRRLAEASAHRLHAVLRAHPALDGVTWLETVRPSRPDYS
jgi:cytosine/adenosine deaminase-related metal-dependent hydrolase